jgi:hypothetical protein
LGKNTSMMMVKSLGLPSAVCSSLVVALLTTVPSTQVSAECLANATFNDYFQNAAGQPIPTPDSCCMFNVCGLACPTPVSTPGKGESS